MSEEYGQVKGTPVYIQKLADDVALRASIGGDAKEGYYIRYRGDRQKILEMLRAVVTCFDAYQTLREVETSPNSAFKPGEN